MTSRLNRFATIGDQVLSSGTNFAVAGVAAVRLTTAELGEFTALYSMTAVAISIVRSAVADVQLRIPRETALRARWRSVLVALAMASPILIALAALLHAWGFGTWWMIGALLLVVLDVGRLYEIAHGQPLRAVSFDLVWLIGGITLAVAVPENGRSVYAAWVVAGAVPGCWALRDAWVSRARSFLAPIRSCISPRLAVDQILEHAVLVAVLQILAVSGSAEAVGEFGLVRTVYGPVAVGMMAIPLLLIPAIANQRIRSLNRAYAAAAIAVAMYALAATSATQLIFASELDLSLSATFGAFMTLSVIIQVSRVSLKALALDGLLVRLRLAMTASSLVLLTIASQVFGANALVVTVGFTASALIMMPVWTVVSQRQLVRRQPSADRQLGTTGRYLGE